MNRLYKLLIATVCFVGAAQAQTPSSILNASDPSLLTNPAGITQVENLYLSSSLVAANNDARITELGNNNAATITQTGANLAVIRQVGDNNSSTILQSGANNMAVTTVNGIGNTTFVSQNGSYNFAGQIVMTNSITDQLFQTGDYNTVLDLETKPTSIPLKIIQSGNSSMAIQNGTIYILH